MSSPQKSTPDGEHLKRSEYVGYALGDTASGFFFQTFDIFLTYYYVDVWGIPATALLWLLPVVRAFGALDDVINRLRRAGVPREAAMRLFNHSSELIHQVYQREKVEDVAQCRDAVQFPA